MIQEVDSWPCWLEDLKEKLDSLISTVGKCIKRILRIVCCLAMAVSGRKWAFYSWVTCGTSIRWGLHFNQDWNYLPAWATHVYYFFHSSAASETTFVDFKVIYNELFLLSSMWWYLFVPNCFIEHHGSNSPTNWYLIYILEKTHRYVRVC